MNLTVQLYMFWIYVFIFEQKYKNVIPNVWTLDYKFYNRLIILLGMNIILGQIHKNRFIMIHQHDQSLMFQQFITNTYIEIHIYISLPRFYCLLIFKSFCILVFLMSCLVCVTMSMLHKIIQIKYLVVLIG